MSAKFESVSDRLINLADLYDERNKLYGNNYKLVGPRLKALFPKGLNLETESDFVRFALFIHIDNKISRYARSFVSGGQKDSLDDLAVYAQMLQEIDEGLK